MEGAACLPESSLNSCVPYSSSGHDLLDVSKAAVSQDCTILAAAVTLIHEELNQGPQAFHFQNPHRVDHAMQLRFHHPLCPSLACPWCLIFLSLHLIKASARELALREGAWCGWS